MIIATLAKRCSACGEDKSADAFWNKRDAKDGLHPHCKVCGKARYQRWLEKNKMSCKAQRRKYYESNKESIKRKSREWHNANPDAVRDKLLRLRGMSREEYAAMLESQQGTCAICKKPQTRRALSIDHDHSTGKIRGLLCDNCNHGLGKFQDSRELLIAAAEYLALLVVPHKMGPRET